MEEQRYNRCVYYDGLGHGEELGNFGKERLLKVVSV